MIVTLVLNVYEMSLNVSDTCICKLLQELVNMMESLHSIRRQIIDRMWCIYSKAHQLITKVQSLHIKLREYTTVELIKLVDDGKRIRVEKRQYNIVEVSLINMVETDGVVELRFYYNSILGLDMIVMTFYSATRHKVTEDLLIQSIEFLLNMHTFLILAVKHLKKMYSTYVREMSEVLDMLSRLEQELNMLVTATGRVRALMDIVS